LRAWAPGQSRIRHDAIRARSGNVSKLVPSRFPGVRCHLSLTRVEPRSRPPVPAIGARRDPLPGPQKGARRTRPPAILAWTLLRLRVHHLPAHNRRAHKDLRPNAGLAPVTETPEYGDTLWTQRGHFSSGGSGLERHARDAARGRLGDTRWPPPAGAAAPLGKVISSGAFDRRCDRAPGAASWRVRRGSRGAFRQACALFQTTGTRHVTPSHREATSISLKNLRCFKQPLQTGRVARRNPPRNQASDRSEADRSSVNEYTSPSPA
jgi:hypothetical protein